MPSKKGSPKTINSQIKKYYDYDNKEYDTENDYS